MIKKLSSLPLAVILMLGLVACDGNGTSRNVDVKLGETFSLTTWDVTILNMETYGSRFYINETDYLTAIGTIIAFEIKATLTGDEPDVFLPRQYDRIGQHSRTYATTIRASPDGPHTRTDTVTSGRVQRAITGERMVADTLVNPGETISGIVLFVFPSGAVRDDSLPFTLTIRQVDSEGRASENSPRGRLNVRELLLE